MSPPATINVVIRMAPDLHAAIKQRAAQEDRTMAAAIRQALRAYVESKPCDVWLGP